MSNANRFALVCLLCGVTVGGVIGYVVTGAVWPIGVGVVALVVAVLTLAVALAADDA